MADELSPGGHWRRIVPAATSEARPADLMAPDVADAIMTQGARGGLNIGDTAALFLAYVTMHAIRDHLERRYGNHHPGVIAINMSLPGGRDE